MIEIKVDDIFEDIMRSDVVEVRCRRCGAEHRMNSIYEKYVLNGLIDCNKCRGTGGSR